MDTGRRSENVYRNELMAGLYDPRPRNNIPNQQMVTKGMLVVRSEIKSLCLIHP